MIKNQKGQSLVEYLIIVAFVGIASVGVMRVLGNNISVNLENISNALSDKDPNLDFRGANQSSGTKSFKDFMNGAKK